MNLHELFTINTLLFVVYVADVIIALVVVFLERKNPSATLAWIMILFLFPIGGIILYFLLSQNIAKKKIYRLTENERASIEQPLQEQIAEMKRDGYTFDDPRINKWKDLVLLNQNYAASYMTSDNRIEIITDGNHLLDSLLEDISKAREYVNVQFFIVKPDAAGHRLIDALTAKAAEGVKVRFLLDALGSRDITPRILEEFKRVGGTYAYFFPSRFSRFNFRFNYRNHRKVAVIDGRIGYLGGFNIGNEYLGKKKKFGYWRDTHIRVIGDCIHSLNATFDLDWRLASRENIALDVAYDLKINDVGNTAIQIVSSGPDSLRQEIRHAYIKMMSSAKKNIYIQSPYFIPDNSVFDALQNAANSGVDVRIMIPSVPDHIFVYWGTYYYCGLLLKSGVKVYIYDKGFLHAKTMSVDGEVCSVGTANFDIRSFKLNFETNAVILDPEEAYKLEAVFIQDMTECHELTRSLYNKRSYWIRFKEGIAKLISDLL
jgi:cardiolipin synthase